jgi:hypothetical protein
METNGQTEPKVSIIQLKVTAIEPGVVNCIGRTIPVHGKLLQSYKDVLSAIPYPVRFHCMSFEDTIQAMRAAGVIMISPLTRMALYQTYHDVVSKYRLNLQS